MYYRFLFYGDFEST